MPVSGDRSGNGRICATSSFRGRKDPGAARSTGPAAARPGVVANAPRLGHDHARPTEQRTMLGESWAGLGKMRIAGPSPVALRRACASAALAGAAALCLIWSARADTLPQALIQVYQRNPQLNAQRAQLRAIDENVSQALSGYRPQLSAALSAGVQPVNNGLPGGGSQSATLHPRMIGVTLTQSLFNGYRTANTVRQAESQVRAGRAALRSVEQTVFVSAVTAYMGVVADQALVEAQHANVAALRQILESTRTRLN